MILKEIIRSITTIILLNLLFIFNNALKQSSIMFCYAGFLHFTLYTIIVLYFFYFYRSTQKLNVFRLIFNGLPAIYIGLQLAYIVHFPLLKLNIFLVSNDMTVWAAVWFVFTITTSGIALKKVDNQQ